MAVKVAVVTGSNKGIGFGIVRALCKRFQGDVILTSRDEARGQAAVAELEKEGLHPKFHKLDINDHASIEALRDFLKQKYNGLDVLVNNAGVAYALFEKTSMPFSVQASETFRTNYFQTLDACEVLFPILKPHARVVNVSSMMAEGALAECSKALRGRFTSKDITMEELNGLMNKFVQAAQTNTHREEGFADNTYGLSKVGVTVMSLIQQQEMDRSRADDIIINACCPGFVGTDLTRHLGYKTIDQGAETPVYLALLPPNATQPRGEFVIDKQIRPWRK